MANKISHANIKSDLKESISRARKELPDSRFNRLFFRLLEKNVNAAEVREGMEKSTVLRNAVDFTYEEAITKRRTNLNMLGPLAAFFVSGTCIVGIQRLFHGSEMRIFARNTLDFEFMKGITSFFNAKFGGMIEYLIGTGSLENWKWNSILLVGLLFSAIILPVREAVKAGYQRISKDALRFAIASNRIMEEAGFPDAAKESKRKVIHAIEEVWLSVLESAVKNRAIGGFLYHVEKYVRFTGFSPDAKPGEIASGAIAHANHEVRQAQRIRSIRHGSLYLGIPAFIALNWIGVQPAISELLGKIGEVGRWAELAIRAGGTAASAFACLAGGRALVGKISEAKNAGRIEDAASRLEREISFPLKAPEERIEGKTGLPKTAE